jgi:hypothetical protein
MNGFSDSGTSVRRPVASMSSLRYAVRLFASVPVVLKTVWGLLVVGMILLIAGYFTQTAWQSLTGFAVSVVAYAGTGVDMMTRRSRLDAAAAFYTGLTLAMLVSLYVVLLFGFVGAITLAAVSLVDAAEEDLNISRGMRMLHFLGVVYATLVVCTIPSIARRVSRDPKARR